MRCPRVGNESITATLGHRFWLIGGGWAHGQAPRSGNGTVRVGRSSPAGFCREDAAEQDAHSLTVEDFHTYFVGQSRLLVHDNTRPLPVQGTMPGLVSAADAEAKP